MNCTDFLERHTEWLDGELGPSSAHELMAHAATCSSCARYDRVVREGTRLVRELMPAAPVSAEFDARMRHRLYHERDAMARRRTAIPSIFAAAASVILITAGAGALAVAGLRTPVVDGGVVFAEAPPAITPLAKHATAAESAPVLALAAAPLQADPAPAAPAPEAAKAAAIDAELEPWPVYSRGAVAVAFPASRTSVVARPADFRPVGSRSTATPLIIRY